MAASDRRARVRESLCARAASFRRIRSPSTPTAGSTSGGSARSRATTSTRAPAGSRSACTRPSSRSATRASGSIARCSSSRPRRHALALRRAPRPFALVAGVCRPHARRRSPKRRSPPRSATTPGCSASAHWRDARRRGADRALPRSRRRDPALRLLPAAGGRRTRARLRASGASSPRSRTSWAIKIAPFNRYQTLDVVRAVADSGRTDIALYTGNDDNIVADL